MQSCDKQGVGHLEKALAVALTPVAFLGGHKRHLCKLVAKHPATDQKLVKVRSAKSNGWVSKTLLNSNDYILKYKGVRLHLEV